MYCINIVLNLHVRHASVSELYLAWDLIGDSQQVITLDESLMTVSNKTTNDVLLTMYVLGCGMIRVFAFESTLCLSRFMIQFARSGNEMEAIGTIVLRSIIWWHLFR